MAKVQELQTVADAEAMLDASNGKLVALLKHSIACPISARGQEQFVGLEGADEPPLYAVVVQYARDVSDWLEERLGVRHETPQVILIKNGEAVHHESHRKIKLEALREAIDEVQAA
jgi:bacillithiol system protein YtxJ